MARLTWVLLVASMLLVAGCGQQTPSPTAAGASTAAVAAASVTTAAAASPTAAASPSAGRAGASPKAAAAAPKRTGDPKQLILSTTTSTQDSGLLDVLIPRFEAQTGYQVKTIAIGSGAAIAMGQRGESDVVLAHAPANERSFVASGAGIDRQLVMYNDFVLLGPASDPAGVKKTTSIAEALKRIESTGSTFVSRGDNSGTQQLELQLWAQAGLKPQGQPWYATSGTGMGQTLLITDQRKGYTISDRATYLAYKNKVGLAIVLEKDPALLNIYHVILVNGAKVGGGQVNTTGAQAFSTFLLAPETQALIGDFGKDKYGQALFTPCAHNSCGLANGGE